MRIINKIIVGAGVLGLMGCVTWVPIQRNYTSIKVPLKEVVAMQKPSLDYKDPCSIKLNRPLGWLMEVNGMHVLADYNVGQVRTGFRVEFTLRPDEVKSKYPSHYFISKEVSEEQRNNLANEGHL